MRLVLLTVLLITTIFAKNAQSNLDSLSSIKYSPFLWKAQRADTTIYLFGTIHVPHPYLTISSKLKTVMKECDVIKTEIALSEKEVAIAKRMSYRDDNKTLEEVLPKETFKRLDARLKEISPFLSAKAMNKFKIWVVSGSLSILKYQLKYREEKAIDKQIYKWALDNNKSTGGVESIEEQLEIFDSFNQQEQIEMLEATLDAKDKDPNSTHKLITDYLNGDGEHIISRFIDSLKTTKVSEDLKNRFLDKLLYSRNVRMANRIEKLISKNPKKKYLFAFGTMHFLGQNSVLYYLEKKGFKIERLK